MSPSDRVAFSAKRNEAYERLHPETVHGGNQGEGGRFSSSRQDSDTVRFTGMTDAALRDAVVEMRNTDRLGWAGMQELAEYEAELHRREAEHRTIYYPAALAA